MIDYERADKTADIEAMRNALQLWIAYDSLDADDSDGVDAMLQYSNALDATRAALRGRVAE